MSNILRPPRSFALTLHFNVPEDARSEQELSAILLNSVTVSAAIARFLSQIAITQTAAMPAEHSTGKLAT